MLLAMMLLCSTVAGASVTAHADPTVYPLSYNGYAVTGDNAADVLGDGKVSYEPVNHLLTLNNATLESTGSTALSYSDDETTLTIKVIGNCRIKCADYRAGMMAYGGNNAISGNNLSFSLTEGAVLDVVCGDWENYGTCAVNAYNHMGVLGKGTLNIYAGNTTGGYGTCAVQCGTGGIEVGTDCTVNLYGKAASVTPNSSALGSSTILMANTGRIYAGNDNDSATRYLGTSIKSTSYRYIGVRPIRKLTVSMDPNGGTPGSGWKDSYETEEDMIMYVTVPPASVLAPPPCAQFDALSFNGVRYEIGTSYTVTDNTAIKVLWKFTHTLRKVEAKAATAEEEGNSEYYVCPDCGRYYADAEGKTEITDKDSVVIPITPPAPVMPAISPEDAKLPTEEKTETLILKTNTDKKDVKGSVYKRLMLRASTKKNTITLKWKKIKGADGYIIYGSPCGKSMKRLATVKKPGTLKKSFKKLKKGKYYKYMVVAYKKTAAGNRILSKSKSVHCCTAGGKKGNPTGIKLKKTKLSVKKGKKVKIKATLLKKKKVATHIAAFRYESGNTKIATVDKNGNVKGKKKGTVTVYVYAQNGICKTVKVTVKG